MCYQTIKICTVVYLPPRLDKDKHISQPISSIFLISFHVKERRKKTSLTTTHVLLGGFAIKYQIKMYTKIRTGTARDARIGRLFQGPKIRHNCYFYIYKCESAVRISIIQAGTFSDNFLSKAKHATEAQTSKSLFNSFQTRWCFLVQFTISYF